LATQEAQIEQVNAKKEKKKAIDCNKTFASIETIKAAKEAFAALPTTTATIKAPRMKKKPRNETANDPMAPYLHQFGIDNSGG